VLQRLEIVARAVHEIAHEARLAPVVMSSMS